MRQDLLTPGVSLFTYTKSHPLIYFDLMVWIYSLKVLTKSSTLDFSLNLPNLFSCKTMMLLSMAMSSILH